MPHYHWKKEPGASGGEMVQVQDELTPAVVVQQPPSATLQDKSKAPMRFACIACKPEKQFRTAGILAIHFGRQHSDLKEDKDSFREYMKEL